MQDTYTASKMPVSPGTAARSYTERRCSRGLGCIPRSIVGPPHQSQRQRQRVCSDCKRVTLGTSTTSITLTATRPSIVKFSGLSSFSHRKAPLCEHVECLRSRAGLALSRRRKSVRTARSSTAPGRPRGDNASKFAGTNQLMFRQFGINSVVCTLTASGRSRANAPFETARYRRSLRSVIEQWLRVTSLSSKGRLVREHQVRMPPDRRSRQIIDAALHSVGAWIAALQRAQSSMLLGSLATRNAGS